MECLGQPVGVWSKAKRMDNGALGLETMNYYLNVEPYFYFVLFGGMLVLGGVSFWGAITLIS